MTIYNWAEIPAEVKWVATDSNQWAFGYTEEPKQMESGRWDAELWIPVEKGGIYFVDKKDNPFKGDWRESLEQRPEGV